MKIRQGFVSNSSSSSFIVEKGKRYNNVFSLARHMLTIRNDDYSDWGEKEIEKITKAEANRLDPNQAVMLRTCNYDTYIFLHQNKFYVSTCNNTSWHDIEDILSMGGGADEGDFEELQAEQELWFIREGVLGKQLDYTVEQELERQGLLPECKIGHFEPYVIPNGKDLVCLKCYQMKNEGKDMFLDQIIEIIKPEYIPLKGVKLR
jgi:hypothetical protein